MNSGRLRAETVRDSTGKEFVYETTTGARQHDLKVGEKIFSDETILCFDGMSLVDKSTCRD